jgi:hypothetical protein
MKFVKLAMKVVHFSLPEGFAASTARHEPNAARRGRKES